MDKRKLLEDFAIQHIWNNSILNNKFLTDPSSLYFFILLSFADLKSYKFVYWFGNPSFVSSTLSYELLTHRSLHTHFQEMYGTAEHFEFMMIKLYTRLYERFLELSAIDTDKPFIIPPICMMSIDQKGVEKSDMDIIHIHTLQEAWSNRFQSNYYIIVLDNNMLPMNTAVSTGAGGAGNASTGWGIRNLLVLLSATVHTSPPGILDPAVNIICLRGELIYNTIKLIQSTLQEKAHQGSQQYDVAMTDVHAQLLSVLRNSTRLENQSVLLQVKVRSNNVFSVKYQEDLEGMSLVSIGLQDPYRVIGWEMNEK